MRELYILNAIYFKKKRYILFFQAIKFKETTLLGQSCSWYVHFQRAYLHWHLSHSRGTPFFFVQALASGSARVGTRDIL